MKIFNNYSNEAKAILKRGGVGVIPTDTIYGILGRALSRKAVQRIYDLKDRNEKKPFIILISSLDDLKKFKVKISKEQEKYIKKNWPGPVSIILPVSSDRLEYLHRGNNSLAFRFPKLDILKKFLKETGPLVAPSANPEGMPPAKNIKEAISYFAEEVDFYIDKGTKRSKPSRLVKMSETGEIEILRK